MRRRGLEPLPNRLKAYCSAIELPARELPNVGWHRTTVTTPLGRGLMRSHSDRPSGISSLCPPPEPSGSTFPGVMRCQARRLR